MEFKKSKVFDALRGYEFLDNERQVVVNKKFIEIYDDDNDLVATYTHVNGDLRIEFNDGTYHTSENLKDYLSLLIDLKECLVK